jgi:hypothetical protein
MMRLMGLSLARWRTAAWRRWTLGFGVVSVLQQRERESRCAERERERERESTGTDL